MNSIFEKTNLSSDITDNLKSNILDDIYYTQKDILIIVLCIFGGLLILLTIVLFNIGTSLSKGFADVKHAIDYTVQDTSDTIGQTTQPITPNIHSIVKPLAKTFNDTLLRIKQEQMTEIPVTTHELIHHLPDEI
jgi:hypothetical protein